MTPGKIHTVLILCLLVTANLYGQRQKPKNESWYDEKPIHFGFTLGFNTMDFRIVPASDSVIPEVNRLNPGINIQVVSNLKAGEYFDLRFLPGVSFGQRIINYYDRNRKPDPVPQELESSFLEFPLLLKYKGERLNNVRPYLIGGFNFRYDLAGKKEFDEKPVYIRLKRPDLYYEAGAGMDFYLTYFKLSLELKLSAGIDDVLVKDPNTKYPRYLNAIEKMQSRIWIFSFHFE